MTSCELNLQRARRFMGRRATAPPAPEIKSGFKKCTRPFSSDPSRNASHEARRDACTTYLDARLPPILDLAACPPPAKAAAQRRIASTLARRPAKIIIRARI